MWARLLEFVAVSGVVLTLAVLAWKKLQGVRGAVGPETPERWRLLAAEDARLREAMDLNARIEELAGRRDNALGNELLLEVHQLVWGIAELVELRLALERHLAALDEGRLEADAALVGGDQLAGQKARLEELRSRPSKLLAATAQAVSDLRQIYLDLLADLAAAGRTSDAAPVVARTRERAGELRARVAAETELRQFLRETPTPGV